MENNFAIDEAKTLYMPKRPKWFSPVVSQYTKCKLPAFFEYAKDKECIQVMDRNESFVNKIYTRIPNKPINTRRLNLGKINYLVLMGNSKIVCSKEVSEIYDRLNKQYRYMINMKDEYYDNLRYVACKIRSVFSSTGYSDETITDMLVEYLYGRGKRKKQLLWFCYGRYVLNNLKCNLTSVSKTKVVQCTDCGEWFEVDISSRRIRCNACNEGHRKMAINENSKRYYHSHK